MKDNNKEILKKVKKWIEFVEEDLRVAKISIKLASNIPYRIIAFHSQQCAEKYLKAFLVYNLIDFPYTHNISTLIELCNPVSNLDKN
jgi:HEPN domain-containing protein